MALHETLWQELAALTRGLKSDQRAVDRIGAQVKFAGYLCELHPDRAAKWGKLVKQALTDATKALAEDLGATQALARAEAALAPLGKVAKQYTIHCVGHGHIDMNWMWDWPETVATVNDTFTTVDRLMEEFPNFHYSQSQASVYQIMKDYLPELYARVKQRIAEGRWEVTASTWVEGSKNLTSGEAMARQLLYTNRFFQHEMGFAPDAVKIDWECDTFGHPHTIPAIISQAGVRRYYFHRGSTGPQLFWWQGVDGSRVLAFDDRHRGYNGRFSPDIINGMLEYLQATGLRNWLFVFGVGDHGGGPTRHDLLYAQEMSTWPIFPTILLSTTDAYLLRGRGGRAGTAGARPGVELCLRRLLHLREHHQVRQSQERKRPGRGRSPSACWPAGSATRPILPAGFISPGATPCSTSSTTSSPARA